MRAFLCLMLYYAGSSITLARCRICSQYFSLCEEALRDSNMNLANLKERSIIYIYLYLAIGVRIWYLLNRGLWRCVLRALLVSKSSQGQCWLSVQ